MAMPGNGKRNFKNLKVTLSLNLIKIVCFIGIGKVAKNEVRLMQATNVQ